MQLGLSLGISDGIASLGRLANYTPSDTPANYVWDARGDFYHSQVAGASPEDHVTLTGPSVVRDSDGLLKWSAMNLADTPAVPATQGVTVISGADYTVEITGTGSITLSGAGSGTVTAGNPVEITASTTTLTCTVSGAPSTMSVYRSDLGGMQNNPDTGDSYVPLQAYMRAVNYAVSGAREGVLNEPQRTNLVTYSDDLTNAFYTKTNITATKDATGADGVANSATRLTASAANGTCIATGITSASAERVYSAWVKRITGTGVIEMTTDNGVTWEAVTADINSSTYTQVGTAKQTIADPDVGFRIVTSGDEIAVQFSQSEVGGFWTSPIPTSGGTVVRAASVVSVADEYIYSVGSNIVDWSTGTVDPDFTEISATKISFDGSQSQNDQAKITGALTIGKAYQWTVTVSNHVTGSIAPYWDGQSASTKLSADGTTTAIYTATGADIIIQDREPSAFEGDVDVVVKEVEASEGTWIMGVKGVNPGETRAMLIDNDTGSELVLAASSSTGRPYLYDGTTFLNLASGNIFDQLSHKLAVSFEDGVGRSGSYDGTTAVTDANDLLPTNPPAVFYIMQDSAGANMPGGILQFLVFVPKRETDAVIEDITDPATLYGTALEILTPLADINDTVGNGPWVIDYSSAYFGNDLVVSLGYAPSTVTIDTAAQTITVPDQAITDNITVEITNSVGTIYDTFAVDTSVTNLAPTASDETGDATSDIGTYSQNLVDTNGTGYITHTTTGFTNTGKLTYSFWLQPNNVNSTNKFIHRTGSGAAGRTLYQDDAEIKFAFRDSADAEILIGQTNNAPLSVGVLTHVYIELDITGASLVASILIDGVEYYGTGNLTIDNGPAVGTKLFNHATAGQICAQSGTVADISIADFFFSSDLIDYAQFHDGAGNPTLIFGDGSPEIKITGAATAWDAATNVGSVTLASGATGFTDV